MNNRGKSATFNMSNYQHHSMLDKSFSNYILSVKSTYIMNNKDERVDTN